MKKILLKIFNWEKIQERFEYLFIRRHWAWKSNYRNDEIKMRLAGLFIYLLWFAIIFRLKFVFFSLNTHRISNKKIRFFKINQIISAKQFADLHYQSILKIYFLIYWSIKKQVKIFKFKNENHWLFNINI